MPAPRKYPNELRERAVRLVLEARDQDAKLSLNAAVLRIGPRVGVSPDTLRGWCKPTEIDIGRRPGTTTADATRVLELEGSSYWLGCGVIAESETSVATMRASTLSISDCLPTDISNLHWS